MLKTKYHYNGMIKTFSTKTYKKHCTKKLVQKTL